MNVVWCGFIHAELRSLHGDREVRERQDAGGSPDVDVTPANEGVSNAIPNRDFHEPEERNLGLVGRPRRAVQAANGLDVVQIERIATARKAIRSTEPMLR